MIKELSFYQESQNINNIGITVACSVSIAFSLILGYTYSILISVIPFFYANFLLTFLLGISLALIIRVLIRLTHNRNKRSQITLAVITGLLANYFQWTTFVLFVVNSSVPNFIELLQNLHWLMHPENLFQIIVEINNLGFWSIAGITFNGWLLTTIWVLEAVIIGAIPVIGVLKANIYPYSERLSKWYPKYTLLNDFESISLIKKLTKSLNEDLVSTIENLGKGNGIRHSKIHLYYIEEDDNQYLSIENIFIEDLGRGKTNKTLMINNLRIESKPAKLILDKFEHKREKIDII